MSVSDSYDGEILSTNQLEDMGYIARESELIKALVAKAMDWFTSPEGKAYIIRYWESESPGYNSGGFRYMAGGGYEPGDESMDCDERADFLYNQLPEYLIEGFFCASDAVLEEASSRACYEAAAQVYAAEIAQAGEEGGVGPKTDVHEIFYKHALWVGSERIDDSVFPGELEDFLEETLRDW